MLMPPTLQPVNANQNDMHVTILGQLYTNCQPSSSLYCWHTTTKTSGGVCWSGDFLPYSFIQLIYVSIFIL